MIGWLLIGGSLALSFVAVYAYEERKRRRALLAFFRQLESLDLRSTRTRLATSDDRDLVETLNVPVAENAALRQHFTLLADLVFEHPVETTSAKRVYTDGAGVYGTLWVNSGGSHVAIVSWIDTLNFETLRGTPLVEDRPYATVQVLPATASIADMVAKHRELVSGKPDLSICRTPEELVRDFDKGNRQYADWRASMDPDVRLERDLKLLEGPVYDRYADYLRKRLKAAVPVAKARRTRA